MKSTFGFKSDLMMILVPLGAFAFILIASAVNFLPKRDGPINWYIYLLLYGLIDAGHQYTTYFINGKSNYRAFFVWFSFILGLTWVIYSFSPFAMFFATGLVTVFHFMRQQIGLFVMTYRNRASAKYEILFGKFLLYAIMIYSLIYWCNHRSGKIVWARNVEMKMQVPLWVEHSMFFSCLLFSLCYFFFSLRKSSLLNVNTSRIATFLITGLGWLFPMVLIKNEYLFFVMNILCHGWVYLVLIRLYYAGNSEMKVSLVKGSDFIFAGALSIGILVIFLKAQCLGEFLYWEPLERLSLRQFEGFLLPFLTTLGIMHVYLDATVWKQKFLKKSNPLFLQRLN